MRRTAALVGLSLMLLAAGCARPGTAPAAPAPSADERADAFARHATEVAETWRTAVGADKWRRGYVPLQDRTVLTADPGFTNDTKQAFLQGWYRDGIPLPAGKPADGTVRFPDGTLTVPLVSARDAYRELDQGDPPPCARPARPAPTGADPNGAVSSGPDTACIPLTVTGAKLGTATVLTSRGTATVPAWIFTIEELKAPIARLAVAPTAITAMPTPPERSGQLPEELVAAQDLTAAEGAKLTYRLGVGACDKDIERLVQEHDDVVVVGGSVRRSQEMCTQQLLLHPVTVTLDRPLGARAVLDVATGRPLLLTTAR
ncbi:hypothetical protein SAMN05444365_103178 [Micromonospora pattaloongensis]|uniref:Lipoprotein n=1 Tax=Micromonospora pattaloongensis TaxID=405436 RepID=A0A1H3M0Q3_9ACTN|nr:hypothetical protein [Micromonospora pattaloongensis]SDY70146.1 hypothetical protein SAMN05444365_103178 [Micromonospora pattaloongensis]